MMQERKNLPTKLITLQTLCTLGCSLDSHEDMATDGQDELSPILELLCPNTLSISKASDKHRGAGGIPEAVSTIHPRLQALHLQDRAVSCGYVSWF